MKTVKNNRRLILLIWLIFYAFFPGWAEQYLDAKRNCGKRRMKVQNSFCGMGHNKKCKGNFGEVLKGGLVL